MKSFVTCPYFQQGHTSPQPSLSALAEKADLASYFRSSISFLLLSLLSKRRDGIAIQALEGGNPSCHTLLLVVGTTAGLIQKGEAPEHLLSAALSPHCQM